MTTTTDLNKWLNPNPTKRPELRIGATVRIHQKIKEGDKERTQIFEGLIIKKTGQEPDVSITVRRVTDGIGIEKVIPVMAANVEKIDIVKEASIRRSKLYYIRDRRGKAARLKEKYLTEDERKEIMSLQNEKEDFTDKVDTKPENDTTETASETDTATPEATAPTTETTPAETEQTEPATAENPAETEAEEAPTKTAEEKK